jgi:hypothetical protein
MQYLMLGDVAVDRAVLYRMLLAAGVRVLVMTKTLLLLKLCRFAADVARLDARVAALEKEQRKRLPPKARRSRVQ